MQYCPKCRIRIRGSKARCPLCQGQLRGTGAPQEDPFKNIPRPRVSYALMTRIVTFLCVSAVICFGAAQIISGFRLGWTLIVIAGIVLGWADYMVAVYYRSNVLMLMAVQAVAAMGVVLLIDRLLVHNGFSVIWVLPMMFPAVVIFTFIAGYAMDMALEEFILYPLFEILLGMFQIVPILRGTNRFIAPAVISMAVLLILVSAIAIFRGRMLWNAAMKYLHM